MNGDGSWSSSLVNRWRQSAQSPLLSEEVRAALRYCADDLADALRAHDDELLSPKEAAMECGLAPATIRKKLSTGDWPNEGAPYRPKVRRRVLREQLGERVATRLKVVR